MKHAMFKKNGPPKNQRTLRTHSGLAVGSRVEFRSSPHLAPTVYVVAKDGSWRRQDTAA